MTEQSQAMCVDNAETVGVTAENCSAKLLVISNVLVVDAVTMVKADAKTPAKLNCVSGEPSSSSSAVDLEVEKITSPKLEHSAFGRVLIRNGTSKQELDRINVDRQTVLCPLTDDSVAVRTPNRKSALILRFASPNESEKFRKAIRSLASVENGDAHSDDHLSLICKSVFDERTEEASASQYFQFYGYLAQQQNMMQDYIRTSTYQRAVLSNLGDFKDKVILDVGAGSGILSFFAVQAGAKRVYAVEASSMAQHCETLVKANGLSDRITVLSGKIEDIKLPEMVDSIISEPMGYMLLNERMLESFLHAKKFLKPGGKMYPSRGDLHIAPFTDEALYLEQCTKANFWCQESFHGVNLTSMRQQALKEYFRQPVVDTFHVGILAAQSIKWTLDFTKRHESDLHRIEIPLEFVLPQTTYIHGLAFWFDVAFIGSNETVWLSTAATEPLTHWYQVRCLLERPILGRQGSVLSGYVHLHANKRQSYDVDIMLQSEGVAINGDGQATAIQVARNTLDLKNPCFRYTGQPVQPPPGFNQQAGNTGNNQSNAATVLLQSPTEAYWQSLMAAAATQQPSIGTENGQLLLNNGIALPTTVGGNVQVGTFEGLPMVGGCGAPAAGANVVIPAIGSVINLAGQNVPLSPTHIVSPGLMPTGLNTQQQSPQHLATRLPVSNMALQQTPHHQQTVLGHQVTMSDYFMGGDSNAGNNVTPQSLYHTGVRLHSNDMPPPQHQSVLKLS